MNIRVKKTNKINVFKDNREITLIFKYKDETSSKEMTDGEIISSYGELKMMQNFINTAVQAKCNFEGKNFEDLRSDPDIKSIILEIWDIRLDCFKLVLKLDKKEMKKKGRQKGLSSPAKPYITFGFDMLIRLPA